MKPIVKKLSVIFLSVLLMLWTFIAGIERLLYFNSNYYPDLLIKNTVSVDSKEKIQKLIQSTCPNQQANIIEKNNEIFIRCGVLWPASKITKVQVIKK